MSNLNCQFDGNDIEVELVKTPDGLVRMCKGCRESYKKFLESRNK